MPTGASLLILCSASIILLLGLVHLLYTFTGRRLHPRDAALETQMRAAHPLLTRRTTMWKAWVGFNASHSFGAILFGLVYGYLALLHGAFLFRSPFLLGLGLLLLGGYVFLGWRYWFSVPFRSIVVATLCYLAALALLCL